LQEPGSRWYAGLKLPYEVVYRITDDPGRVSDSAGEMGYGWLAWVRRMCGGGALPAWTGLSPVTTRPGMLCRRSLRA